MAVKHILVIGASGYLGSEFVRCLLNKNFKIYGTYNNNKKKLIKNKNVKYFKLNSIDQKTFNKIKNLKVDYVVNFSGYVNHSPIDNGGNIVIENHLIGLFNINNFFLDKKIKKFINIGSSDEYGEINTNATEINREAPFSPYSYAKTASTYFLQMINKSHNFNVSTIRFFLVYGPRQEDNRLIPAIIKGCINNHNIDTSPGMQIRDFLYIDDAMSAIIKILNSKKTNGEVFNVCSAKPVKIKELIINIKKIIGKGKINFGARPYRKGESMRLVGSNNKLKKMLGWQQKTSLKNGLIKTIGYYKND